MSSLKLTPDSHLRMLDVPVFDEGTGFQAEAPAMERAGGRLEQWAEHREEVIKRIRDIADELDRVNKHCNISTVAGSSIGIAGGAAVIGGLIMAPPLAIGGLIVGGVAAASNITTTVVKVVIIKKRAKEVMDLLAKDTELFSTYSIHVEEMKKRLVGGDYTKGEDIPHSDEEAASEGVNLQKEDIAKMTVDVGVATAAGFSAAGARAVLLESSRLAPMVAKGLAHGAAGVGIALDLLSLILSSKDLAKGSALEYAEKLREVATGLKLELYTIAQEFVSVAMSDL